MESISSMLIQIINRIKYYLFRRKNNTSEKILINKLSNNVNVNDLTIIENNFNEENDGSLVENI